MGGGIEKFCELLFDCRARDCGGRGYANRNIFRTELSVNNCEKKKPFRDNGCAKKVILKIIFWRSSHFSLMETPV